MATLPLKSLKVLDLTRVLAGPLCTMLLGDLGADVIKVERPGRGDDTRDWGPPFDDRGESAYYLSINRNKLSLAAGLEDDRDRALVLDLMQTADVVVDNFLPGALQRAGIDVHEARRQNPGLIWCTITGFGSESRRPGYDFVVQAEAGWMTVTGTPEGEPMKAGVALADVLAGKDAAIAILAALAGSARGAAADWRIVISLADSARAALVNVAQNALVSRTEARRWGNAHANLVPYQLFQAQDRALVIAVGTDDQWVACIRALGLSDLERDPKLATNRGRLAQRDRVIRAFEKVLASRPAGEWMRALDSVLVPCGVVKSVLEVIQDTIGASELTGMPSSVGGTVRLPPPALGQHGELIRKFGWTAFSRT